MFYSYEILKKNGKFGIVWLASTNLKSLTRRDFATVDVARTCSDVEQYIHQDPVIRLSSSRLSLYLSAQLLHGITVVSRKQHDLFLEDLRNLWEKLPSFRPAGIDVHVLILQPANVTLDESRLFEVGPDFGNMKALEMASPDLADYDYFPVASPRSTTPEGSIPRPLALPGAEQEELPYTVPREQITLPEIPRPEPSVEQTTAPDLAPFDLDDFEGTFLPRPSAPLPPALYPPITPAITSEEVEGLAPPSEVPLVTPAAEVQVGEPSRPRKPSAPPADLDITELPAPVRERRRRGRALELNQFELEEIPPAVPRRRRPRRRRLIIDDETQISRDFMRQQMAIAAHHQTALAQEKWSRVVEIPSIEPSPDSLFRRPGSRVLSNILRRPWENLRTTAVPNDTAPPGAYCAGYEESPVVSAEELEEPPPEQPSEVSLTADLPRIQHEEMEVRQEVETPRVHEFSGLQVPPQESGKEVTVTPTPEVSLADASKVESTRETMVPIEEVEEPKVTVATTSEASMADASKVESTRETMVPIEEVEKPKCMVSPERTPPPRSPEVIRPISPSPEKVVNMIASAFIARAFPEHISFKELVPPRRYNRAFAAKTFTQLLELHKRGDVNLQQGEVGEILITRGQNF